MIFGKISKNSNYIKPKITIDGEVLDIVAETKLSGIILDSELNWKSHVNYTSKKLAKAIAIISKTKQYFNRKTLLQMYYSFMYPYLTYANVIWGNAPATTLWPIYKLQKIALRMITNTRRGNSTQTHCKVLKILRLPEIYTFSTSIFMYKYLHNMMPPSLNHLFQRNQEIHHHYTRGASNLRPPNIRTKWADNFITATGVRIWNQHSINLDPQMKLSTYKKTIIQLLIAHYHD